MAVVVDDRLGAPTLGLEPDLVLGFSDLQADIAAELIRAGIEVHVFNHRSVAEILRMIATLRQVANPGNCEGALWAGMRIHRISSEVMLTLGYSSKLNAEWGFLCMLRDEGRRAAEAFLKKDGKSVGQQTSFDLDTLLEGI